MQRRDLFSRLYPDLRADQAERHWWSGITLFAAAPVAGFIADRVGALRHGLVSSAVILAIVYPLFAAIVAAHDESSILLGQFALTLVTAFYVGALPAILAELFVTRSRSLGRYIL